MVAEAFAALGGFKALLDVAKSLKDMNDASVRGRASVELLEKILAAQEAQAALTGRVRELEEQMTRFERWESEKQRYELQDVGSGALAYAVKAGAQGTEPAHSICPDCYEQRVKSILQTVTRFPNRAEVKLCQRCGWESYVMGGWHPEHGGKSASRRRP